MFKNIDRGNRDFWGEIIRKGDIFLKKKNYRLIILLEVIIEGNI